MMILNKPPLISIERENLCKLLEIPSSSTDDEINRAVENLNLLIEKEMEAGLYSRKPLKALSANFDMGDGTFGLSVEQLALCKQMDIAPRLFAVNDNQQTLKTFSSRFNPSTRNFGLSPEEVDICKQLNITPKLFAESR